MPDPIDTYWQLKLQRCRDALKKNHCEVFIAADAQDAGAIFRERIFPTLTEKSFPKGRIKIILINRDMGL